MVGFDNGLQQKFLTRDYITAAISDIGSVSVESVDDKGILVWDDEDSKEILFRFLEEMGPEDLASLISISEDIPERYQIDKTMLAEYLWNVCDRNAFVTLEELVVIWSEPDDVDTYEPTDFEDSEVRRLCDEYGDEYALEVGKGYLGQLWFERNITVVNMGEIVRTAQSIARENNDVLDFYFTEEYQIQMGFFTTVLHELRHLQMDTNILLPEEDYPLEWASEGNVEEYCRAVFESTGIPDGLMPGLYGKSLDDVLADVKSNVDKFNSNDVIYKDGFVLGG